MTQEENQVLALIAEYKTAVAQAITLLNAKSELQHGFQLERTGYLDESSQVKYQFHGFGCLVRTPEFVVDFDFGERSDGIDAGFLASFLSDNAGINARYSAIRSTNALTCFDKIEQLLAALEANGILVKNIEPFAENRYFLATDIKHPSPPLWRSYPPDDADTNPYW